MDLIELLQREIHDLKMQWSKLKEENVVLRGFKAMVMQEPRKYHKPGMGHNNPPSESEKKQAELEPIEGAEQDNPELFEWKEKYNKEHKLRQEAETETILVKGIGMNSPEMKAAKLKIEELQKELDRIKKENNECYNRIAALTETLESKDYFKDPDYKFLVDENHRLEQQYLEVMADNKRLAQQIEDRIDKMRKSGM